MRARSFCASTGPAPVERDRHGDGRAVDDRRRVEVAKIGAVDGVDGNVLRPRRRHDRVHRPRARRSRRRRAPRRRSPRPGTGDRGCSTSGRAAISRSSSDGFAPTRRMSASVSRSRRTLAAASPPPPTTDHGTSGYLVKGRKYGKPFRLSCRDLPGKEAFQYGIQALGLTAKACSLCAPKGKL